ncbi:MAG TPA: dihydroorotase [Drouetiella sp.]
MAKSMLIKNALLVDEKEKRRLDVRIENGVISDLNERIDAQKDEDVVDAANHWLTPGFIDLHTHLRDLGQSNKEDIFTGTRAAACGGYTTVVAMANTIPPTDNVLVMSRIKQLISERACIEVLPVACVTKGMAGQELTEMVELASMGVVAFSDDGLPVSNLAVLRRALEYADLAERFIMSHAEDRDLAAGGSINESPTATRLGLASITPAAESACIAREIEVVRQTGGRVHFAHVSTAASVNLIRAAKADKLRVSADVTPHHLVLTDEDIKDFDTSYKMNPPLRSRRDLEECIRGLKDGTLDAIATDHAPHSRSDKAKTFDEAPFGIIGLETAFALCYEHLVLSKQMTEHDLFKLMTFNPASIINRTIKLEKGAAANFAVLNPKLEWTYLTKNGYSKSINSPFNERKMTGKNVLTIFNGTTVYKDEENMSNLAASHS